MKQRGHFSDLDGMRGILASTVMLSHFGLNPLLGRLTGGLIDDANWGLCVDFFFLLSGFVLCRSYCERRVGMAEYFTKRVFRLAPMYFLTLALALAVTTKAMAAETVTTNLLMVQPFLGIQSINVPSWSIPYELFLPVAIVFLAPFLVSRGPRVAAAGVILLIGGGIGASIATQGTGAYESVLRPLFGLGAGMFLYLVYRRRPATPSRLLTYLAFGVTFASIALTSVSQAAYFLFFPASVAAIYFGAPTTTLLSGAPAQALGRWSYSIYLIHFQVMLLTIFFLGSAAVSGGLLIKGAWVVVTIALAAASYRWIEAPMIEAGAKAWRSMQSRTSPAVVAEPS